MVCLGFKGGIGTASRTLSAAQGGYTVGVLVQCNFGARRDLRIAGVPVGEEITDLQPCIANNEPDAPNARRPRCNAAGGGASGIDAPEQGSIIVIVATDAPLMPDQLKRVATRVALGVGRQGGFGGNGSGDIFVAFSTANAKAMDSAKMHAAEFLDNSDLDALFEATAQATEEAIVNAMVAARDMVGDEGHSAKALPHDALQALLKRYGRAGNTPR